jgi:hypothetical protein
VLAGNGSARRLYGSAGFLPHAETLTKHFLA